MKKNTKTFSETKKELPKLPHGMGSYAYFRDKIRYRKSYEYKGQTKRLTVIGSSLSEVNKLMREKELEWQKTCEYHISLSGTITLQTAMKKWMELYKKPEVKDRTYDRLETTFSSYIENTSLGRTYEKGVTSDMIQEHLVSLKSKTGQPLSYSSIKKIYELLDQYFRHKYIREPHANPMLTVTKPNKEKISKKYDGDLLKNNEEMNILTDEEMDALTEVAYTPFDIGKKGFKKGLGIVFIMWVFLRSGEARGLKWEDIDFKSSTINIKRQITSVRNREDKAKKRYKQIEDSAKYNSARKFKMPQVAVDIAAEYKRRINPKDDSEYFLANSINNRPISETSIRYTLERMLKAAGIDKHIRIHDLRHSGISYMLRHEVPVEVVSRMAGHKEIETTYRVYYQILEKQKTEAIDDLDKRTYKKYGAK